MIISLFIIDVNGNPVTQSVISVTDPSGNPVTGSLLLTFNFSKI